MNCFLRFVVADQRDDYYHKSGVKLDFRRFYRVKLQDELNPGKVYFVSGNVSENQADIQVYHAAGSCIEYKKKRMFGIKASNQSDAEEFLEWMLSQLKRNKNAVVMDVTLFHQLLPDERSKTLGKLIEVGLRPDSDRGNLLLCLPMNIDDALPVLQDPYSPLVRKVKVSGKGECSLCEVLFELQKQGEEIFDHLRCRPERQITFLGEITAEGCKAILRAILLEQFELYLSEEELNDCAWYLQMIVVNRSLGRSCGIFSDAGSQLTNARRSYPRFREIYEAMKVPENLQMLVNQVQLLKEVHAKSMKAILENREDRSDWELPFDRSDMLVQDLCSIDYPPEWYENQPRGKMSVHSWKLLIKPKELKKILFLPCTYEMQEELKTCLKLCFSFYHSAEEKKDDFTLWRAYYGITYIVENRCISMESEQYHNFLYGMQELIPVWLEAAVRYHQLYCVQEDTQERVGSLNENLRKCDNEYVAQIYKEDIRKEEAELRQNTELLQECQKELESMDDIVKSYMLPETNQKLKTIPQIQLSREKCQSKPELISESAGRVEKPVAIQKQKPKEISDSEAEDALSARLRKLEYLDC